MNTQTHTHRLQNQSLFFKNINKIDKFLAKYSYRWRKKIKITKFEMNMWTEQNARVIQRIIKILH